MADIRNYNSNSLISGTSENDYIGNYNSNVTLSGGNGDDTIWNCSFNIDISGGAGNDSISNEGSEYVTISGGKGNDTIYNNYGSKVLFKYAAGDGNDIIQGFLADSTLKILDSSYSVKNNGYDIIVTVGKGKITLVGAARLSQVNIEGKDIYNPSDAKIIKLTEGNDTYNNFIEEATIKAFDGNDSIKNSSPNVLINVGDGDDYVRNESSSVTIIGETGNDKIENAYGGRNSSINSGAGDDTVWNGGGSNVTINCGAGNDSAEVYGENISISGGAGNDKINLFDGAYYSDITVNGGKGDDIIYSNDYYDNGNVLIEYTAGDGNDIIYDFKGKDTLSISGGSYSTQIGGDDVIVTVGKGKITLLGAASLGSDLHIKFKKTVESNSWKISGTTATYGTANKTLATVKGVKSVDGLSISGKVITVAESSLNKKKITISGNGYKLALGNGVIAPSTKKAAWTLKNSTATYKSSYKTAGYSLASNGKSISYSKATTAESLATVEGVASTSGLSVNGNKITLKKSALKNKVTVSGDYEFDFASDYKKATISGSSSDDTITTRGSNLSINGGKGNDTIKALGTSTTLTVGAGSDVFIYKSGKSGIITDYAAEDKISISGGKVSTIKTSGSNVIFTVGTGKITVKGGKDKTITYSDTSGKNKTYKYEEEPIAPADDEIVILPKTYAQENYTMSDNVLEVDASAVRLDISITSNKFMNKITGGKGNDTLIGGGSNDTLTGGDGADTFVYALGDGNDLILDYSKEDVVSIKGDTVKSFSASSDDIIFNLASKSKITIAGGKDKLITYVDDKGEHIYPKIFTVKGKTITLTDEYTKNDFDVSDYGNYNTINASAVEHSLNIVGNDSANSIFGTADDDTIDGAAGKDTIRGGEGNDSMLGGDGNDYLYGGAGNDTLWGGKGNDWLEGGADRDIFVFNSNEGTDTISGYEQGLDKIMIFSNEKPILDGTPLSNDVTFNVGKGKIVVDNGANQTIQFVKSNGKNLYTYIPSK